MQKHTHKFYAGNMPGYCECAGKDKGGEKLKLVNMDLNNGRFKIP